MVGSMGRVVAVERDAAMESFFSLPQKNAHHRQVQPTGEELRIPVITWIERTA